MLFQKIDRTKLLQILVIFISCVIAAYFWHTEPAGTSTASLRIGFVFLLTIISIITGLFPMGLSVLLSLCFANILGVLSSTEVFAGYSSKIVWLVIAAFFIARAVIKTGLGARIAYILIAKFGNSLTGLSYSLVLGELLLSPIIPSATARSSGIFLPIGKSLIDRYKTESNGKINITDFITTLLYHTNVITSAMFVTAMAANPLAVQMGIKYGANITWGLWASAAFVPGFISLLILPLLLQKVCKLTAIDPYITQSARQLAKKSLDTMGKLSSKELYTVLILFCLILSWIFEFKTNVNSTISTILAVSMMLVLNIISWDDVIEEKAAWSTFLWFGGIISISDALTKSDIVEWLIGHIMLSLQNLNAPLAAVIILLIVTYAHYIFASSSAYLIFAISMFTPILIKLGFPQNITVLILSFLAVLSAGFTHYGSASAPPLMSMSSMPVSKWWRFSALTSNVVLMLWALIGAGWWKLLGLW